MVLCAASLSGLRLRFTSFFRVNARLSYALYLVHFPLLPLAFALGHQQHPLTFWISYICLSYAVALLVHFGIEKPFLTLKNKLNEKAGTSPNTPIETVLS